MPFQKGESGNPDTQFSSTNQPTHNGRKKKIYNVLKETGYSRDDIGEAFKELAFYSITELNQLAEKKDIPVIVNVVCEAYKNAAIAGDFSVIRDLISHVIGRARSTVKIEVELEGFEPERLTESERKTFISLLEKGMGK